MNHSIAKLKKIYREYSSHQSEISLKEPVIPNNAISLKHDNISFRTLLRMVTGLSDYSAKITSREISFTENKPEPKHTYIEQNHPHAFDKEAFNELLENPKETREYLTSLGLHTPAICGFPDGLTQ